MPSEKLNVDIPRKVSEFEAAMQEFFIRRIVYRIVFRGKGLEFDSYRDFSPDDDASDIDWKASARANKMLVKQYVEERDLKIMFVVDVGENMVFGSQEKLKCEYAAEMIAALSHLILGSRDQVGFIFFNEKIIDIIMPEPGIKRFHLFADKLSNARIYNGGSNIEVALDYLINYLDESINSVILVSDFIKLNKNLSKKLNLVSTKFETMALMVKDPLDMTLPDINEEIVVEDPLTKEQMIVNPLIAKRTYEKNAIEKEKIVEDMFQTSNIDFLKLSTDESFVGHLANFLKGRLEKRKYMVAG